MNGGLIKVQIIGADIPMTIDYLCDSGMILYDVRYDGKLSATLEVSNGQYRPFRKLAEKRGNEVRIRSVNSVIWNLKNWIRRPVLMASVMLILFLTVWMPSRVLFIAVEGNTTIPATRILQEAEKCGIYFGAKRNAVRSEIVKNHLLESISELRWAGVTTDGCTAVIRVLEETSQVQEKTPIEFSSVVAERDGIITSCTVTSGTAACVVGDAVKEGQVLISGCQNLGLMVKLTRSQGEIFAQTERNVCLIMPLVYEKKQELSEQTTRYSLIIGKNRINLSKGSGISYTGCDKIYTQYYLTLPGGYILPAALTVEQIINYEQTTISFEPEQMESYMLAQCDSYLLGHTVSGTIQSKAVSRSFSEQVNYVTVQYTCVEMIGRECTEEINIQYGKAD